MKLTEEFLKESFPNLWQKIHDEAFDEGFAAAKAGQPSRSAGKSSQLSAEQIAINAQMGIKPEEFHKFANAGQQGGR